MLWLIQYPSHLFVSERGILHGCPTVAVNINLTIFLIQQRQRPVFFVEIKAAEHLHKSTRAAADKEMRERLEYLGDHVEIPILFGVSAIGPKLCFYKYTKDTRIFGHTKVAADTAPRGRWEFDVLMVEGEWKLREVIGNVKRMCEQGWFHRFCDFNPLSLTNDYKGN